MGAAVNETKIFWRAMRGVGVAAVLLTSLIGSSATVAATPEHEAASLEQIEEHIEKYIGPIETVYHELVSDQVHLDLLWVKPTDKHPYHVFVTSGVSDKPMTVPEGLEDFRHAELMIVLPKSWQFDEKSLEDEGFYWPLRWLKMTGRLPHEYSTWLGYGHTIPNGDPPEPIANTKFIGVMLTLPEWLPEEAWQARGRDDRLITFYMVVPLYADEMNYKLDEGAEALEKLLTAAKVGHVLDTARPNVVKKLRE
jgi:hypothetical protein